LSLPASIKAATGDSIEAPLCLPSGRKFPIRPRLAVFDESWTGMGRSPVDLLNELIISSVLPDDPRRELKASDEQPMPRSSRAEGAAGLGT
jgi:hypothetical protein